MTKDETAGQKAEYSRPEQTIDELAPLQRAMAYKTLAGGRKGSLEERKALNRLRVLALDEHYRDYGFGGGGFIASHASRAYFLLLEAAFHEGLLLPKEWSEVVSLRLLHEERLKVIPEGSYSR